MAFLTTLLLGVALTLIGIAMLFGGWALTIATGFWLVALSFLAVWISK